MTMFNTGPHQLRCEYCDRPFIAIHENTRYCTYGCKEKAYIRRRRKRDRSVTPSPDNLSPDQLSNLKLKKDPLDDL